ncbi:MAG: hypothetical protein GXY33_03150 [Phycisphaerae bacterium]|nr:hypothetical protein [Phycisphaerae bacterium]
MARIFKAVLVVAAAFFMLHGGARGVEVLLDADFGQSTVERNNQAAGSFRGVLPEGWTDSYVGWSKSDIQSQVVAEDGTSFLRLTIARIDPSGNPQLMVGLPPMADGEHYRLILRARNRSTGPLSLGVRMGPAPYHYRYERQLGWSAEWVEKSWVFRLNHKTGESLGLFLAPCGSGVVDVSRVRLEKLSTPEEVAAAYPRPDKTARNFFRNSRLPLGLQAGWNLGRYPHPSLAAHANLAQHLEGREFLKAVELGDGIYAFVFVGRDRTVAVISGRPGCAAYRLPVAEGLEIRDLFGNPLPQGASYRGTLMFVETAMAADAMERLFTGQQAESQ